MDPIIQEAFALQEDLTAYRHFLHQNPELGLNLPVTSSFIRSKLDEFGIPNTFSETSNCVTAVLGQGEKCIMLRADMDALPIKEDTGEPFSSNNEYMHACGHDLHATALLGAARLLKAHESELKGKVKLLFQAGEETFTGADAALKDGVLENPHVDVGFAMHSSAAGPVGLIRMVNSRCLPALALRSSSRVNLRMDTVRKMVLTRLRQLSMSILPIRNYWPEKYLRHRKLPSP
ncbi:MAG: M20/M25/M40 family metallo-hydrolase [Solobacterium sp.]|nr:M20/M25/M40 family metallo-hydrolase [Solobacterium sp.]